MWEVLANISSICGIIGFPLALWQICGLKSKIESTEKGIKSILDIKEHEELNYIFDSLAQQYEELSWLITQINKPGSSKQSSDKKCRSVIKEITSCIIRIQPQYAKILNDFKSAIKHIENFIEADEQSNVELKEARDYLYNAMQKIKYEKKVFEDKEIYLASHNNE